MYLLSSAANEDAHALVKTTMLSKMWTSDKVCSSTRKSKLHMHAYSICLMNPLIWLLITPVGSGYFSAVNFNGADQHAWLVALHGG